MQEAIDFSKAYGVLDTVAYMPADRVVQEAFSSSLPNSRIAQLSTDLDTRFRKSQSRYHAVVQFMSALTGIDKIIFTSYLNSLA